MGTFHRITEVSYIQEVSPRDREKTVEVKSLKKSRLAGLILSDKHGDIGVNRNGSTVVNALIGRDSDLCKPHLNLLLQDGLFVMIILKLC